METVQHVQCQSCGVELALSSSQRATLCPYCLSPSIVERPKAPDRPPPVFAMGFRQTRDQALQAVQAWTKSLKWGFRRGDLHRAKVEDLRGLYVPVYLFSALAEADYHAEIGENYQRRNRKGETKTETEWRSLAGHYKSYISDVIVTASRGIDNDLLQKVEPFEISRLRRYQPEIITGWIAEDPSLNQAQCRSLALEEAERKVRSQVDALLPGDKKRSLRVSPRFDREALDLCLVPLWSLGLRYAADKAPMRVLVNGQTGMTFGFAPWSLKKIGLALALLAAAVAALVFHEPLLRLLGA